MIVSLLIEGAKGPQIVEIEPGRDSDYLLSLLQRGWLRCRPAQVKVSSLNGKPITDANGHPVLEVLDKEIIYNTRFIAAAWVESGGREATPSDAPKPE